MYWHCDWLELPERQIGLHIHVPKSLHDCRMWHNVRRIRHCTCCTCWLGNTRIIQRNTYASLAERTPINWGTEAFQWYLTTLQCCWCDLLQQKDPCSSVDDDAPSCRCLFIDYVDPPAVHIVHPLKLISNRPCLCTNNGWTTIVDRDVQLSKGLETKYSQRIVQDWLLKSGHILVWVLS